MKRAEAIAPSYRHPTNKVLAMGYGVTVRRGMFPSLSDNIASARKRATLESQIERMRRDVEIRGECIVRYDELRALCANAFPPRNQWEEIAKIAIDEGWRFTFFPNNSVRFAMG
jgi:hypothetical protein